MSSAVVVSDVHIGDNSPTNWYQASVHEPRLVEVLDQVAEQAQAGEVTQLVLLGDLVDIWTYPPSVPPPTMAQIIAANPKTLGPGGALARAVQALPGAVTLMLGNHDGTLTDADVQTLSTTVGGLRFQRDGILTLTGASGRRTTFAHGHYWTMFNAPDRRSPWSTLPVGHFVTRAFAFHLQRTLKPGQTAADLKDMGSPNGFDLTAFLESLSPSSTSVAGELLDFVAREAKMRQDTQIVLPGGTQVPYSAAHDAYKNLFTQWADDWDSDMTALRAALADQWGTHLAWFAQLLAIRENADLVVFGHTHQPVRGMVLSPIDYINSGYECVSNPDMPKAQFTFTLVDLETASGKLLAVDPSGTKPPRAFDAPAIPPVAVGRLRPRDRGQVQLQRRPAPVRRPVRARRAQRRDRPGRRLRRPRRLRRLGPGRRVPAVGPPAPGPLHRLLGQATSCASGSAAAPRPARRSKRSSGSCTGPLRRFLTSAA
jgi:UDP-2,3-diacylglucosamine pyrophosphatase LpxH